ncbi:MAG: hypothetical protein WBQ45_22875 [Roseiarcus sp.]
MRNRLTFLNHFVICLAIAAGAFFAALEGVPQVIFVNDLSHVTSVIGALFVSSAIYLGWQAWRLGEPRGTAQSSTWKEPDPSFGHLAERLCVACGIIGTGAGLALQGQALMAGAASFGALSTAIFTTVCGVLGYALTAVLTYNLEVGIRRARR